jgi:PiT family inorganic phosphate transporter
MEAPAMVAAVVALALVFDFTNGFHDAANAVATSISTRALAPRVALAMSAVLNFAGALLGVRVAHTIQGLVDIDDAVSVGESHALWVIAAALIGAAAWNVATWFLGLPASSSHALIGGIVGAGLASATTLQWSSLVAKVLIPMLLSPALGFLGAFALMVLIRRLFRSLTPARAGRGFRWAQTLSAAAMSLGHGLQDAQKTMGVIVLALVAGGYADGDTVPLWVIVSSAAAIAAGTYSGGWRIMRTLGRRIVDLDPPKAFAAESTAALVLYGMAIAVHAPVSTTHTIASAVLGAGVTSGASSVRWIVVRRIVTAWVITLPAAAVLSAAAYGFGVLVT